LVITFVYGALLDQNYYIFKWSLPLAGLLSMIGLWLLSTISFKEKIIQFKQSFWESVKASSLDMVQILKRNQPYRHFEIGFMFYGFSFMVSVTVIAIFFYEGLDLNYTSVAFYKNAYNILAIILLPYFGGLLGNLDPRKFSVVTYSSILLYIFFLMLTVWFPVYDEVFGIKLYYVLILYILAHGVFAATMVLLWNIGSAYFCSAEEAGTYQSVHLFLTGFRALFAPTIGVVFYEQFGLITTFTMALISLTMAIGVNIWSYRKDRKIESPKID